MRKGNCVLEKHEGFYTLKGYARNEPEGLSPAMEDYLEMICRLCREAGVARVSELAQTLHVRPSSASKMVANLREAGYLSFERYGYIVPTARGEEMGRYLLQRHRVLHSFFCLLNGSEEELRQVEKIEHFIDRRTVENLARLTEKLLSEGWTAAVPEGADGGKKRDHIPQ